MLEQVNPYFVCPGKMKRKLFEDVNLGTMYQRRLNADMLKAIDMNLDDFDEVDEAARTRMLLWLANLLQHGIVNWGKVYAEPEGLHVGVIKQSSDFRVEKIPGTNDFRHVPI